MYSFLVFDSAVVAEYIYMYVWCAIIRFARRYM